MEATRLDEAWSQGGRANRPWMILVSTPSPVGDLPQRLGTADYSYGFVVKALTPVLERLGAWRSVGRPESSLMHAAAAAAEAGYRPVHLAISPVHRVYLTPAVPTLLFPFWEFPRIPDRDFGTDTRQNWARIARHAAGIITACRLTADAFRRADLPGPIAVIPVPLPESAFEVPDHDETFVWKRTCRHVAWGGEEGPEPDDPEAGADRTEVPTESAAETPRGPLKRLGHGVKHWYKRHIRPCLSPKAQVWVSYAKYNTIRRIRRWAGIEMPPPRLTPRPLRLGGLVYTSIFNLGDQRKNPRDLLSAFLLAFRDRPDVTLVLKLATPPELELETVAQFQGLYGSLGIEHRCRIVVITDYLTDADMAALMRVTTYYVNTSRAEGACLPLQQALAAGRPVLAPAHTAMADYIDDRVGFVIGSHAEPTHWPHDPEQRIETTWHRLVWTDLHEAFLRSAAVAEGDRPRYEAMATAARKRMADYASVEVVTAAFREILDNLEPQPIGRLDWNESVLV